MTQDRAPGLMALRDLFVEAEDLIPRMSEDDPIAPALRDWLRRVSKELSSQPEAVEPAAPTHRALGDELADELEAAIENALRRGEMRPKVSALPAKWRAIISALRSCAASGRAETRDCPLCKGTGKRLVSSFADSSKQIEKSCSGCKGSGKIALSQGGQGGVE